ncbi:MAG: Uma2 family endonuclease [Verrucomicrobiae bacterium]|nr:Uma2 family endonuclease [Verrucomicrobiae bacterium]
MPSILDDPQVRQSVYPLSVQFYHQAGELGLLGDDVELLEGTLVKKMPKSPLHEWIVGWLVERLRRVVGAGWLVRKEGPLTFQQSEPEPDLAIVLGELDDFIAAHPSTASLVIEVAISTLDLDRQKVRLYAVAGVAEYWIVRPEIAAVEVYRSPVEGQFTEQLTVSSPAILESKSIPGLAVPLAELFPGKKE